jgi:hypothetical protein
MKQIEGKIGLLFGASAAFVATTFWAGDALAYNTAAAGLGGNAVTVFYTQILGGAIGAVLGGGVAIHGFKEIIAREYLHGTIVLGVGVIIASLSSWVATAGAVV